MATEKEAKPAGNGDSTNDRKITEHANRDEENRRYAAIGLSIMCLATLSTHAIFFKIPSYDPVIIVKVWATFFMVIFWAVGLNMWMTYLGQVSVTLRNNSVLGGLFAANAGLAYTVLWNSSASLHEYLAYACWPTYLGMILGVVM